MSSSYELLRKRFGPSSDSTFVKSSYASVIPQSNAFDISKSWARTPFYDLITYINVHDEQVGYDYTLSDVIDGAEDYTDHNYVRDQVKTWLKNKLPHRNRIDVRPEHSFHYSKCVTLKRADIAIIQIGGRMYVQFEVQSNSRVSTLRKLGVGLVDQLNGLLNQDFPNKHINGYYVSLTGGFERMTCKFQEHKAKYICSAERVMEADDVLDAIMADFKVQEEFFASPYPTKHLMPLSHRFVVSTWGDGAFQLPSGFSVVILARKVNSAGFEILKHPLSSVEYQRLDYLLDTDVPDRHFCYPCGSDKKSAVKYFKYPALDPPKDYQQLQRILVSFIRRVIVAVNEMHDLKLAHLDIRADNVCFRNSEPVLIDLDRSMELNTPAAEIQSLYASSDHSSMYSSFPELKERATASHIDWKQVAIMAYAIYSFPKDVKYHKIDLSKTPCHTFLKTMFTRGN